MRWSAFGMRRFIITVLVATMLHAIGCILAPPFEFGHSRAECFFFAFVSGIVGFSILFAVLLLPLRAGLRRLPSHFSGLSAHQLRRLAFIRNETGHTRTEQGSGFEKS